VINLLQSVQGTSSDPVTGLTPTFWYRYAQGIVTSGGVSSWADQSGNNNNIQQVTAANRPTLLSDNAIRCEGTSTFMTTTFTFNQPETVYILYRPMAWTSNATIFDGKVQTGAIVQSIGSPTTRIAAPSQSGPLPVPISTYAVECAVFNGTSSIHQVNTSTTGLLNAGVENMGGLTFGSNRTPTAFSAFDVKEIIGFSAAHDVTTRAAVITYLATVGGVNL